MTSFRPRDFVQVASEEPKGGGRHGEGKGERNGRGRKGRR